MSVKIQDFTPKIASNTKQRASIFLRMICDDVVDGAKPFTPKKDGFLNKDILKTVVGLHGTIEWRKGYATYQERGMRADGSRRVKRYTTPGTGPHFAENAVKRAVENTPVVAKLAHLL